MKTLGHRLVLCYWPCLWCSGGRVTYLAPDWRRLRVRQRLGVRTRNVFHVIFGGSMYASTDPMYVLMLMKILGHDYITWDKGCTIRFKRPATGTMHADFKITDQMLAQVVDGVRAHDEITVTWPVAFRDDAGVTYAEFDKVIYVARKDFYREKMRARAAARAAAAAKALVALAFASLASPRAGHAAGGGDDVRFATKLARQRARGGSLVHAWRPGEMVRAPVFVTCDERLTLSVDAFAPGGLGRREDNDRFRVEGAPPAELEAWRGRGFDASLEIVDAVPDRGGLGNVQTYRAVVRAVSPRDETLNPGRWMVKDLAPDAVVRLRGEVRAVGATEIVVRGDFYEFKVQLGGRRPGLAGTIGDEIRTRVRGEPPEVGDVIGLHALVTAKHDLVIYPGRPIWLIAPSPARRSRDLDERRIIATLFDALDAHAGAGRWAGARVAFGELQRRTLDPRETARLDAAFARTPGFARPVRIDPRARALIALVDETFDVDVEEMTAGELTAFADRWARREVAARAPDDDNRRDETLIYRALEKIGVPAGDVDDVARRAVRARTRWLELRARTGVPPDAQAARELMVIEESLAVLRPNAVNVRFLVGTAVEAARRAGHDPAMGRRLVPALALALARLLDDLPADARDEARGTLRRRRATVARLAARFTGQAAGRAFARATDHLGAL